MINEQSWRLKLYRAEEHFCYFKLRVAPFQERQAYPVSEGFEPYGDSQMYTWRLQLPPLEDPSLAVIVGDVLFNVRSALDHLAMALVPPRNRTRGVVRATQFPIFTCDIDELDPFTGKYLHGRDRGRWDRATQGMTPRAVTALKFHQPYRFHGQGLNPRDSSFAILSSMQNADKHRQLTVVNSGIGESSGRFTFPDGRIVDFNPPPLPAGGLLANGTVVGREPVNDMPGVKMEIIGSPLILISESPMGPYRECPDALALIIDSAWDCVARLEGFIID